MSHERGNTDTEKDMTDQAARSKDAVETAITRAKDSKRTWDSVLSSTRISRSRSSSSSAHRTAGA